MKWFATQAVYCARALTIHHPHVLPMQQGCKCLWFGTNPPCSLYVCIVPDCNRYIAHPSNCIQFHMVLIYCEGRIGVEGTKFNISAKLLTSCAGRVSRLGSGLFLLAQVIILLDFTHNWNATWVAKDEQFQFVLDILLISHVLEWGWILVWSHCSCRQVKQHEFRLGCWQ